MAGKGHADRTRDKHSFDCTYTKLYGSEEDVRRRRQAYIEKERVERASRTEVKMLTPDMKPNLMFQEILLDVQRQIQGVK